MHLSNETQQKLRNLSKININEVVIKEGDLFIALNVITQERRLIDNLDQALIENLMFENKKRVLKG